MKNEESQKIVFLTLIAGRRQKDALFTMLSSAGAHLINIVYGKGTVGANYLKNAFGLIPEETKIVITCLLAKEKCDVVFHILVDKFHFDKPNTGIAFCTSIEKLSF